MCFLSLRTSSSSSPLAAGALAWIFEGGDERAGDFLVAFGGLIGLARLDGAAARAENGGGDLRASRLSVVDGAERGSGGMLSPLALAVRTGVVDLRTGGEADLGVAGALCGGVADFLTSATGFEMSTFRTGILEGVCFIAAVMIELRSLRSASTRDGVEMGRATPGEAGIRKRRGLQHQERSRDNVGLSASW